MNTFPPTTLDVPLSLFDALACPADDPAIVQVWAAYFDEAVEDELASDVASCQAVRDAFTWPGVCLTSLTLAIGTLPPPPGVALR